MAEQASINRIMAPLLERCADPMLKQLQKAVSAMPGERARQLEGLLMDEVVDRQRRALVLGPIMSMFRPRSDGIEGVVFPAGVLPRLWKLASAREPALLPRLDKEGPHAIRVADRICLAAAAAVRDQPEAVWPESLSSPAERSRGLIDLAASLDLIHLARKGLSSLDTWLKRPDGDQVAELRLMIRDSAEIVTDGAQRVLEILFSHLDDAVLILRILTQASGSAGRESFLSASELAGFVDRLIAGVIGRVERVGAFKSGAAPIEPVIEDIAWCSAVLAELEANLQLQPDSAWGRSARSARVAISKRLCTLLRTSEKLLDGALPLVRVRIAGGMSREAPDLEAPSEGEEVDAARELMRLVGAVRGPAGVFGCESERKQVVEILSQKLSRYAEEAIGAVNTGELANPRHALDLVSLSADFLTLLDEEEAARTIRRRAAIASRPKRPSGAARAVA
ncbi:hypothetical protein [uncultured Brevundimonas sp.]|uniref:hypothetical protein n=1 Tax=uncultured Brevundimonas sp. TaxID=213418 RepID=UPI0030EF30C9|tara:strand:- start:51006 stop:52361 length:1356 start_codon:yes stop_codon:yes gene_type:complete